MANNSTTVAKILRDDATQGVGALQRPTDTTDAAQEIATKDVERTQTQQAAISSSKSIAPVAQRIARRSPSERALDTVNQYLATYKQAPIGDPVKVVALEKIVGIVSKHPKKSILDTILAFFVENKNEEFLNERNALQGIGTTTQDVNIRIRVLYKIMIDLAFNRATRKTLALTMVRNIFGSDDLINWIAVKLPKK